MKNALHTTFQTISGILAFFLLANLIVHIPFYIVDGNILKLFTPIWMYLDGITILLCVIYVFTSRKQKGQ